MIHDFYQMNLQGRFSHVANSLLCKMIGALPHQVIMQQLWVSWPKELSEQLSAHSYLVQMSTLVRSETQPVTVFESLYFTSAIVCSLVHVFKVLYG